MCREDGNCHVVPRAVWRVGVRELNRPGEFGLDLLGARHADGLEGAHLVAQSHASTHGEQW